MDRRAHWESVYRTKGPEQVSWFQAHVLRLTDCLCRHEPRPDARRVA